MADKEKSKGFLDNIEDGLKEYWAWILAALILWFIFAFNLQYGLIRAILPIIGVIILGRIAWAMCFIIFSKILFPA